MEGIVCYGTFDGAWVAHESRAMEHLNGLLGREARGNEFPPAGEAEHQVRLNEPERDVQIGGYESLVDVDRCPGGSVSERPMFRELTGVVVHHPVAAGNIG